MFAEFFDFQALDRQEHVDRDRTLATDGEYGRLAVALISKIYQSGRERKSLCF
ncbi:MAG: hypothetical protein WC975_13700 [Phycisphaerae bacterium]